MDDACEVQAEVDVGDDLMSPAANSGTVTNVGGTNVPSSPTAAANRTDVLVLAPRTNRRILLALQRAFMPRSAPAIAPHGFRSAPQPRPTHGRLPFVGYRPGPALRT